MRRAGYLTAHVGRFLNGYKRSNGVRGSPAPGWERWITLLNLHYRDYDLSLDGEVRKVRGSGPHRYATRDLHRRADRLLRQLSASSRPFYLQFDELAPHSDNRAGGSCLDSSVPGPGGLGRVAGLIRRAPRVETERRRQARPHPRAAADHDGAAPQDPPPPPLQGGRAPRGRPRHRPPGRPAPRPRRVREHGVRLLLGQRLLQRRAPGRQVEGLALRGGDRGARLRPGAGRLPRVGSAPEDQAAERQHRPRADHPRPRRRPPLRPSRLPAPRRSIAGRRPRRDGHLDPRPGDHGRGRPARSRGGRDARMQVRGRAHPATGLRRVPPRAAAGLERMPAARATWSCTTCAGTRRSIGTSGRPSGRRNRRRRPGCEPPSGSSAAATATRTCRRSSTPGVPARAPASDRRSQLPAPAGERRA